MSTPVMLHKRKVCCHECKSEQLIPRGGDQHHGLFFDCSRCENGFCGGCFQKYGETEALVEGWGCFVCQGRCRCNVCRTPGKKRKAPFRLTAITKKRRKSLSHSTDETNAPSQPPSQAPSSPRGRLSSSDTKARPTPTKRPTKRPSQKKKTGTQLHLSYFNNSLECLLEASDTNSDWVDPVKCNTAQIQDTLREMLRCLLLFCWRSVVTHVYSGPFLVPVKESEAPNYSSIISHPMDLSTIRKKIDSMQYSSAGEMLEDVVLMCENCRTYCSDRFPHLIPQADTVLDLFKEALSLLEPALLNVGSLLWPRIDEGAGPEQSTHPPVEQPPTIEPTRK